MGVINEELDLSIDSIDNGTADTTVDNGSDTTTITNPPAPEDKGSNEGNNQQSSSTGEDTTTQTDNNTANNNQDVTVAEGDQVTIDDIPCTVDAQGNAVDANGTIVKTSEELRALIAANTTEEPSVLSVLQERFGADFKDEMVIKLYSKILLKVLIVILILYFKLVCKNVKKLLLTICLNNILFLSRLILI